MKFSIGRAEASTPQPVTVRTAETPHAEVDYPGTMQTGAFDGADLVLTFTQEFEGFTPNLVLTSVESTAPLTDASTTAVLAAPAQHSGAQLLAVDAWALDADTDLARARRVLFAYHGDRTRDVLVSKWVWATGTHHVHLSASFLPSQAAAVTPTFDWVAARLRLRASEADVARAADTRGEAALDEAITARTGHPFEDLRAAPSVRFRSTGPVVSDAALEALLGGAARSRIGAARGVLARADRVTETVAQLTSAGWIDAGARLTELGSAVAAALSGGRHILTAQVRRGMRRETLVAYAGPRGVVVAHGPSLGEAVATAPGRHIMLVAEEQLPTLVAAWLGLRPAWGAGDAGETVSADDLERHVTSVDESVEPWTEILVRDPRGDRYGVWTPSRGYLRVGRPEGGVHTVDADVSGAWFDHILAACDAALG